MKLKIIEMYKKLRPFYVDAVQNEKEYYIIYDAQNRELEVLDYEELEKRNDIEVYFTISESVTLQDIYDKINDYVREYDEYLRRSVRNA